jgi:hypothetical protein
LKPFEIHKQVITASSRKLSANWTIEAEIDERIKTPWELINTPYTVTSLSGEKLTGEVYRREIKWYFKKDSYQSYEFASIFDVLSGKYEIEYNPFAVEEIITKALSAEIAAEIDNEILNSIINEAWIDVVEDESEKIEIVNSLILADEEWINTK